MGPEFVGKTKDSKTKDSPDLSSKAVEKAGHGTQTVDETQTVHETLNVDVTKNGYEKDAIENPTAKILFLEPEIKRILDQMAKTGNKLSKHQSYNTKMNFKYKAKKLKSSTTMNCEIILINAFF